MDSKKCNRCREVKVYSEFTRDKSKKDGLRTICKNCTKIRPNIPKARNPEFDIRKVSIGEEVTLVKKCSKCLDIKNTAEFDKSKHCAGGFASRCKKCLGSKGLYTQAKLSKIKVGEEFVDAKDCGKCRKVKPLTSFPVIKSKRKGIGGRYSNCSECEKQYRQELMKDDERKLRTFRVRRKYESNYQDRRRELYYINIEKERERSKVKDANRFALHTKLRNDLTTTQYDEVLKHFDKGCALTGIRENITLDHFIPLWTGHGGTYVGNVYPLKDSLNYSKQRANPFEWAERMCNEGDFKEGNFVAVVKHLAKENRMSVDDFRSFVDWCFENRREPEDITKGGLSSVELYHEYRSKIICRY